MNKFQFIKQLLDTKKFTPSQKERFLKLASAEIGLIKPSNEELWEEIEKIREKLNHKLSREDILPSGTYYKDNNYPMSVKEPQAIYSTDNPYKRNELALHEMCIKAGYTDPIKVGIEKDEIASRTSLNEEGNTHLTNSFLEIREEVSTEQPNEQVINEQILRKKIQLPEANPKHVADFMTLFNQRDGLKYLTHDYDENSEFEIDKFLISAKKVFNDTTKKLNIPQSLWRIVKQFAFDSKQTEWTSISEDYKRSLPLKIGWATKELRDWSKQNHLHPIRNKEYEKIINDFKRITRIESSNLEKLIDTSLDIVFEKELLNYEIKKIDLLKADFYSHVGFLKIALETIFEEILKRSDSSDKKKITFNYERSISSEGYYVRKIRITHHNSFPSKELAVLLKEWQEKGNMGKIKEKLRGYCHWSVETIIEDSPIRVNILKEKESAEYEHFFNKPNGFTHLLTFYYK